LPEAPVIYKFAQRQIALMQEFLARLIANIVTGKLDVRAVAASLPEVAA
jgi:type I restriction enzyme S subunit